jgi:hypothetical protein
MLCRSVTPIRRRMIRERLKRLRDPMGCAGDVAVDA